MTIRLGIIGAGQLGLYLCEAAQRLGISVAMLSATGDAPALPGADRSFVGALDHLPTLDRFIDCCDVVSFDKEDIPDATLSRLREAEQQGRIAVNPGTDTLRLLKDKGLQKTWLSQQGLPTLPFDILSGSNYAAQVLLNKHGETVVQKSRCGGYDGRGVQVVNLRQAAKSLWDIPSILEPYLADRREISIVTVRTSAGETQSYPPVSMEFDPQLNAVSNVCMPALIDPQLSAAAIELAERTVQLLNGVGVFAIEMFITAQGELLINEIAPRVHNSGHLTLDACNVSQFEQHVRAVVGLPLVTIRQTTPGAMLNLLYTEAMRDNCPALPTASVLQDGQTTIYWYGKPAGIIGRKMGHINTLAADVASAVQVANRTLAELSNSNQENAVWVQ